MSRGELKRLAELVRREQDSLLDAWRREVRGLPGAEKLDTPSLNDHIPHLLEELSRELEALRDTGAAREREVDHSVTHGEQRFGVGFRIEEVVSEYNTLRGCLQDLAERNGLGLHGEAARVVNDVIDRAIALAVKTFAERQSEELRRRREEHFSFIAHDLKTPLSAIAMAARLLEDRLPDEARRDDIPMLLQTLRRNVSRLNGLVKAVTSEEGRLTPDATLKLHRREIDLWPLVQRLVYDLRPLAETTGTRVKNAVPEDLVAYADAPAISQVLQNLLSNALKYTPGGTVTVEARALEGGGVECSVMDTGEGIAAELISGVFDKGVTDPARKGSGLGLTIVRQVITAHGGQVDVKSGPGQGAAFTFTLPGKQGVEP